MSRERLHSAVIGHVSGLRVPVGRLRRPRVPVDTTSIVILKTRELDGTALVAAVFDDIERRRWFWYVALASDAVETWTAFGGGGSPEPPPRLDRRWVNLEGASADGHLYIAGRIIGPDTDIAQVRLKLADGAVVTDTVDDGVVLLLANRDLDGPCFVDLYNREGEHLATQQTF